MRPKLFFQALLGIVSVGAIIMIVIVYFFGDNNTKVVEKVVEKQVVVYQQAPAAVTPVENHTVVQQPAAPSAVPVQEVEAPAAEEDSQIPYGITFEEFYSLYAEQVKEASKNGFPASVSYENDTIVLSVYPNDESLAGLFLLVVGGHEEATAEWGEFCNQLADETRILKQRLVDRGYADKHYSIRVYNDESQGFLLLVMVDGVKAYDLFEIMRNDNGNT